MVRVHTVILIFNSKWKMDTRFPFSIYDENWTMKNGHPISFSIFHRKWKNGKWVSIFDYSFCICDGKYKMGNWKSDKNDNAYPGPLAQLLVKLLLFANVRRSSEYYVKSIYEDHILFNYLVKLHATPSGSCWIMPLCIAVKVAEYAHL